MPAVNAEEILAVLDRPIAFQRVFVEVAGSVAGAVMLSQMVYWQRRSVDGEGWWYKSRDDWTAEVGVTRREQESARGALVARGILEEETRGVPRRLYYRLRLDRLAEIVSETSRSDAPSQQVRCDQQAGTIRPASRSDVTSKQVRSVPASRSDVTSKQVRSVPTGLTETTQETTQETKQRENAPAAPALSRSSGLDPGQDSDAGTHSPRAPAPPTPPSTHGGAGAPATSPPAPAPRGLAMPPPRPMRVTQDELDLLRSSVNRGLELYGKAQLPAHAYAWEQLWRLCAGDVEEAVRVCQAGKSRCAKAGNGITLRSIIVHYENWRSAAYQAVPRAGAEVDDVDGNEAVLARLGGAG